MTKRSNWKTAQKKLEAWRFWSATAEYAVHAGQSDAVELCRPTPRNPAKLGWRGIDKATRDLRAMLGIRGRIWEPLPAATPTPGLTFG